MQNVKYVVPEKMTATDMRRALTLIPGSMNVLAIKDILEMEKCA